ncbi:MAG: FtsQ-type POTRA domain-containing protein [bacterium]|jgi:hypothetical protein
MRAAGIAAATLALLAVTGAAAFAFVKPRLADSVLLKQIVVSGNVITPSSEIVRALGMHPGESLIDLDLKSLERKVEKCRFVSSAEVRRVVKPPFDIMGGILEVRVLSESLPVARAFLFGRKYWLTSEGRLIPASPSDADSRFDSARRSPSVYFHSTRQVESPEFVQSTLAVLSAISKTAPGLIREVRISGGDVVTLVETGGTAIRLETMDKPEASLANLADVVRLISANRLKYREAVLSPDGESFFQLAPKIESDSEKAGER